LETQHPARIEDKWGLEEEKELNCLARKMKRRERREY
jgi:hypothetical protein